MTRFKTTLRKKVKEATEKHPRLDQWFSKIAAIKKAAKDDSATLTVLEDAAIKYMTENEVKQYQGVRVVRGSHDVLDDVKLKSLLDKRDPALWGRVTKTVLDQGLLEAAIQRGEIPATLVQKAITSIPNREYLNIHHWKRPTSS